MAFTVNVNSNELIEYSKKLDKLHRSAFPVTVRQTLSSQAFQTKEKELIQEYNKAFTVRSKGFSKSFSKAEPAKGFEVNRMFSTVGMQDKKRGGTSVQAGRDMDIQQAGGIIRGRSFIPTQYARTGKNWNKNVRRDYRLGVLDKKIGRASEVSRSKGRNRKQRFIRTAAYAATRGNNFMIDSRYLYLVTRGGAGRYRYKLNGLNLSITPLYSYRKGRSVRIRDKRKFTEKAARRVNMRSEQIFKGHAKKQFKKAGIR